MPKLKTRNYRIKDIAAFARRYPKLVEYIPESYKPLHGKIESALDVGLELEGIEMVQLSDVKNAS
jgi:hypothetical protein